MSVANALVRKTTSPNLKHLVATKHRPFTGSPLTVTAKPRGAKRLFKEFRTMARVAVQMLEDQIAMGVDVNDVSLRDAKAMMVKTKETLDEVRMLQAWSAGRRDEGM